MLLFENLFFLEGEDYCLNVSKEWNAWRKKSYIFLEEKEFLLDEDILEFSNPVKNVG
jgi:hypothetical protein